MIRTHSDYNNKKKKIIFKYKNDCIKYYNQGHAETGRRMNTSHPLLIANDDHEGSVFYISNCIFSPIIFKTVMFSIFITIHHTILYTNTVIIKKYLSTFLDADRQNIYIYIYKTHTGIISIK